MKILSTMKNKIAHNKTNIKISSAFVICIFFILLMSVGYSDKIDEIRKENIQKYDDLVEDYNSLVDEYNSLYKKYNGLNNDNNELQARIQNYQDQQNTIDELASKLTETQDECESLKEKIKSLKSTNDDLNSEIEDLKSESSSGNGMPNIRAYKEESNDNYSGGMVWISETGSKYHNKPNCGRMNPNRAREVSKSSAESMGLSACSKCF